MFECADFPQNEYDYKADIWSFGITLIELAEIEPPHHTTRPERLFPKVVKGPPPQLNRASGVIWKCEFHDILTKCLQKDPQSRSTAAELLGHPFLCDATDVKPLMELLAEFKAEIIDEDDNSSEGHQDEEENSALNDTQASETLSKMDMGESFDETPEQILIKMPDDETSVVHPESKINQEDNESNLVPNGHPVPDVLTAFGESETRGSELIQRSEQTENVKTEELKAEEPKPEGSFEDTKEKDNDTENNDKSATAEESGKEEFSIDELPSPILPALPVEPTKRESEVAAKEGGEVTMTVTNEESSEIGEIARSNEHESHEHENISSIIPKSSPELSQENDSKTKSSEEKEKSDESLAPEIENNNSREAKARANELKLELGSELSGLTVPAATTRIMKLKGDDDETPTTPGGTKSLDEEKRERVKSYKSIRRTRRFVIDGQVVTSTQKRVVTVDGKKDLAFEKLQKRKEAIRQVQKFQRKEKVLFEKSGAEIEAKQAEFENKKVHEEVTENKNFESEREKMKKNYQNALTKLVQKNENEFQSEKRKFKQEMDQSLKKFKSRMKDSSKNLIKIEESRLTRDEENSDKRKELLKQFKVNLEKENAEKERQHSQSLENKFNEKMKEMKLNHNEECLNLEMHFLSEKQSLAKRWNKAIDDLKEYSIQEKAQLLKQANRERFDLVRKLNLEKYDRQLLDMTAAHEKEMEDLKAAHLNDSKMLPKELEKENKSRLMMHRRQIEIMLEKKEITESEVKQRTVEFKKNDQKRKAVLMKKREQKRKEEIVIMKERQENEVVELMSFQNEQKARLDETEKKKEEKTDQEFRKELEKFREERKVREKQLEIDFLKDVESLKKNYELDNDNVDHQMKVGFDADGSGSWSPTTGARRNFSQSSSSVPKSPLRIQKLSASLELSGGSGSGDRSNFEKSNSNSEGFDIG